MADSEQRIERLKKILALAETQTDKQFIKEYPCRVLTCTPSVYASLSKPEKIEYVLNRINEIDHNLIENPILINTIKTIVNWASLSNATLNVLEVIIAIFAQYNNLLNKQSLINLQYERWKCLQISTNEPRFTVKEAECLVFHKTKQEALQKFMNSVNILNKNIKLEHDNICKKRILNLKNQLQDKDILFIQMLHKAKQNYPNIAFQKQVSKFISIMASRCKIAVKAIHAAKYGKAIGVIKTVIKQLNKKTWKPDQNEILYNQMMQDLIEPPNPYVLEDKLKEISMKIPKWNQLSIESKVNIVQLVEKNIERNDSFENLMKSINDVVRNNRDLPIIEENNEQDEDEIDFNSGKFSTISSKINNNSTKPSKYDENAIDDEDDPPDLDIKNYK